MTFNEVCFIDQQSSFNGSQCNNPFLDMNALFPTFWRETIHQTTAKFLAYDTCKMNQFYGP